MWKNETPIQGVIIIEKLIIAIAILASSSLFAYSESDILKLKSAAECENWDLSGAKMGLLKNRSGDLYNLTGANLSNTKLKGVDLKL